MNTNLENYLGSDLHEMFISGELNEQELSEADFNELLDYELSLTEPNIDIVTLCTDNLGKYERYNIQLPKLSADELINKAERTRSKTSLSYVPKKRNKGIVYGILAAAAVIGVIAFSKNNLTAVIGGGDSVLVAPDTGLSTGFVQNAGNNALAPDIEKSPDGLYYVYTSFSQIPADIKKTLPAFVFKGGNTLVQAMSTVNTPVQTVIKFSNGSDLYELKTGVVNAENGGASSEMEVNGKKYTLYENGNNITVVGDNFVLSAYASLDSVKNLLS
jgi:hypothetical protein